MTSRKMWIGMLVVILVVLIGVRFGAGNVKPQAPTDVSPQTDSLAAQAASSTPPQLSASSSASSAQPLSHPASQPSSLDFPLANALARVTKKPFAIFITPATSPVQPERFRGYHTGTDFETFPGEQGIDVPVSAICDGTLVMKKWATGYGGVAVERCTIDGQPVTVVYGHLKLASVTPKVGDAMKAGQTFAVLGKGFSTETDGERKHLHLGIHKGTTIDILGYVQKKSDLSQWIDPMTVLQAKK